LKSVALVRVRVKVKAVVVAKRKSTMLEKESWWNGGSGC
jgi:hypothetical protein